MELVLVVDNLRVGSLVCKREFVSFRLDPNTCFNISSLKGIIFIGLPLIRNDALLFPCLNFQYNFKKRNETAVREEVVELTNLLDGVRICSVCKEKSHYCWILNEILNVFAFLIQYYKMLNIRVVLVGLVIFKDSNPFSIEGSAGDVLGRFVDWRKTSLLPKMRHDIGQLIV